MPTGIYKRIKPIWNKGFKTGFLSRNPEETKRKLKLRVPWNRNREMLDYPQMGFQKRHPVFEGTELAWFPKGIVPLTAFKKGDKRITGERNNNWKGGITEENHKLRNSIEYRLWRESVFARDSWTCQECGQSGGNLNADHIKPFALFPELRFAIDNGLTLCVPCHKKTPSYLNRWISKSDYE